MTQPEIGNDDTDEIPGSNTTPEDQDDGDDDSAIRKARREAASLRKRLRDTEAERDQLRDQLDTHRQDVINDIATQTGLDPALLTDRREYDLSAFITDEGTVDREKVEQVCRDMLKRFAPKGRRPAPNPQMGRYSQPQRQPADEFRAAFAPKPQ